MRLSLAIHIISIVFWIGGLIVLTRVMSVAHASGGGESEENPLSNIIKRSFIGYVIPGLVLTLLTGLYQMTKGGAGMYMQQGWFHGKLTLVIVLLIVTAVAGVQVKAIGNGNTPSRKILGMLHGFSALGLVLIALLTMLGR